VGEIMTRVLVAHADEGERDAIAAALMHMTGHDVVATANGVQSLSTLCLSGGPLIALVDERLLPFSAVDLFRIAASDKPEGELGRHRYVLLST
jgi:hypothetical protein